MSDTSPCEPSFIQQVIDKTRDLNNHDLSNADRAIIRRGRLQRVWTSDGAARDNWRHRSARSIFATIQDRNPYLLLAVILSVPPTKIIERSWAAIIDRLLRQQSGSQYRPLLSKEVQTYIDDISIAQGFANDPRFKRFQDTVYVKGSFVIVQSSESD